MEDPTPAFIDDADNYRSNWLQLVYLAEERYKANAFDKHFQEYEKLSHVFFRQEKDHFKGRIFDKIELVDASLTEDFRKIQEVHVNYGET